MLLSQITIVHHSGRIGSNIGQKVSHYDRKLEWRGNIVISSSVAKITYIHTWWVKVAYLSQRKCLFFSAAASQITDASAGWESCMRKEYPPLILISAAH